MKTFVHSIALAIGLAMLSMGLVMTATTLAFGYELSGYVSVDGMIFASDALHSEQENGGASLALVPELYHQWENGSALTAGVPRSPRSQRGEGIERTTSTNL